MTLHLIACVLIMWVAPLITDTAPFYRAPAALRKRVVPFARKGAAGRHQSMAQNGSPAPAGDRAGPLPNDARPPHCGLRPDRIRFRTKTGLMYRSNSAATRSPRRRERGVSAVLQGLFRRLWC